MVTQGAAPDPEARELEVVEFLVDDEILPLVRSCGGRIEKPMKGNWVQVNETSMANVRQGVEL